MLVFLGRSHLYEGLPVSAVVHGVRTAVAAVLPDHRADQRGRRHPGRLQPGQPVLISDHLNLTGRSPLTGPPRPAYPARFTDLTDLYAARLRAIAREADPSLAEGVYAALPGPHYETPAEIRMLRSAGADLVGMSTALEAIAARHPWAPRCWPSPWSPTSRPSGDRAENCQDVLATGQGRGAELARLLRVGPAQVGAA